MSHTAISRAARGRMRSIAGHAIAVAGLIAFAATANAAEQPAATIPATHSQERLITVVTDASEKLTTFAVDTTGRVLAGVAKDTPVIRVYAPSGERTAEWKLPIPPEAVNVGPKGDIFVAGQGVLLRLDDTGDVKLEKPSPNMATAEDAAKEIQQRVQDKRSSGVSAKQQAEIKLYKKRLAEMQQKIADLDRDLFALDQQDLDKPSEAEAQEIEAERSKLQKRRDVCMKLQAKLELNIVNPPSQRRRAAQRPSVGQPPKSPEPEVDVRQLIANQMRIASISASQDEVFFACSSSTGSGFDVWRTSYTFAEARKIGEGLRGCCGQLDVQANDNGIYVAENTRHRVRGFSRDGRQVLEFGSRQRGRDDAFDGCCNPMNVAFGDDGSVYTAESGSGRVKRFAANGTFMELVGQVDLVPGCKKVSIAVSPRGDEVYMLDITRGHIVVMSRNASKAAATPRVRETKVAALSSAAGFAP